MLRLLRVREKVNSSKLKSTAALLCNAASIAFTTTRCAKAGSCAGSTTDVHGTSRALGFQLSGRRRRAGRTGRGLRRAWHDGDGGARPRRSLRRAAFLSRREKALSASAHRRGSDFHVWLALSAAGYVAG